MNRRSKGHAKCDHKDEVTVEDADDKDDEEFDTDSGEETEKLSEHEMETPPMRSKIQNLEVSKAKRFTVYVNKRPTSMSEVIKDLEAQFTIISDSAKELLVMLEANRVQYATTSHELTAMKILNPMALLRSASSSSSNSSRFLVNSSVSSKEEGYASSSDLSDDPCLFQNSHQSTLEKLYDWEKKLYQEVKAGEKNRIAYCRIL
uniref:Nitrate regulatory gene2 protein n=1 Tax=Tanacetum cinerariifolium TaxID=118510 RepID=A0A699L731_TANCI|nr:nitrate regulatory gene2 protein [Tanacetum cinerariifolium]